MPEGIAGSELPRKTMGFITEDFLLQNKCAKRLYENFAAKQPVLDYHCHIPVQEIAQDRQFGDLYEIWLEGDHYKWRAMRANGIPERYCTGDAEPFEKFVAWAKTVPHTLRNPLYHWNHLELLRYFEIEETLNEQTAPKIWQQTKERLKSNELSARGILKKFHVRAICTTDDPADPLDHHKALRDSNFQTHVFPTFRPDGAYLISNPEIFNAWVEKLAVTAETQILKFEDFLQALGKRHQDFHDLGCRLSDHGLDQCYAERCSEAEAEVLFNKVRVGKTPNPSECAQFASYMMIFFGKMDAEKGWVKQLHLGALRNVNDRMLLELGRDTGFDSIGDLPQASSIGSYLDSLNRLNALPKMILYNVNPADNYAFATMIGNFQDGSVAGRMQFGAGWWFLDQKEAIENQLNALSNCGLLSHFIGMLTDSRSFMSFPRHEYFRRVLCNLIGSEMETGLLPNDEALVGDMVRRICYENAERYLGLPMEVKHSAGHTNVRDNKSSNGVEPGADTALPARPVRGT